MQLQAAPVRQLNQLDRQLQGSNLDVGECHSIRDVLVKPEGVLVNTSDFANN
jgi:hypothetical protein